MLQYKHRIITMKIITMKNMYEKVASTNWQKVTGEINGKGYAMVPQFLPAQFCDELIEKYDDPNLYRKTIIMERYHFGLGEYRFIQNLPLLQIHG
jgi:hypothetical protein